MKKVFGHSWIEYIPQFISADKAMGLKQHILDTVEFRQEHIMMFGKRVAQPRLTAWYGQGLSADSKYSKSLPAEEWTAPMLEAKSQVEAFTGVAFNSALVNYYRTGQDSMGLHADDEPVLGRNPLIASLSLGGDRKFVLRKKDSKEKYELLLQGGSLLVMGGALQEEWKHELPKSKTMNLPRINLTFRALLENQIAQ